MLEKHVLLFVDAINLLDDAKMHSIAFGRVGDDIGVLADVRTYAFPGLGKLKTACVLSDMDEVVPQIERLEAYVGEVGTADPSAGRMLAVGIRDLIARLKDDLESQFYFHLTQSDVPFYLSAHPFGEEVSNKFPKAIEDIDEAGKCIALQRPTASVFHLMRVLEHGVQALGKKLKVKINVQTETWHQIMLHVHKACEALPSKDQRQRKRKSAIAEAAANLQSIRLAWRNEVMHPKQTYGRDEALKIFNATHAFMASLADLV